MLHHDKRNKLGSVTQSPCLGFVHHPNFKNATFREPQVLSL